MIKAEFYPATHAEQRATATVSVPVPTQGHSDWSCVVSIEGLDQPFEMIVHAEGEIPVLIAAFQLIRRTFEQQAEEYLYEGKLPLNYAIPRTAPCTYGNEVIEKIENYIEEVSAQKEAEWRSKVRRSKEN